MSDAVCQLCRNQEQFFEMPLAFETFEFLSKQRDTDIRPGQSFPIDYSITRTFALNQGRNRSYNSATSATFISRPQGEGFEIAPVIAENTRYRANAIRAGANVILPLRKTALGVRYFHEFANEATVEGESLQLYVAVTF